MSLATKCFFIAILFGAKVNEVSLIMVVLIVFVTLFIPNFVLSLISISCSTGLNKKLLKVILNYPASWMLPIATYFMIGPYKSNCCCQTNASGNLGLSKFYCAVNILFSLALYVAVLVTLFHFNVLFSDSKHSFYFAWGPVLVIGLVFNIIYLNMDKQCCISNCCCEDGVKKVHVMNVNRDDLQIVTIEND